MVYDSILLNKYMSTGEYTYITAEEFAIKTEEERIKRQKQKIKEEKIERKKFKKFAEQPRNWEDFKKLESREIKYKVFMHFVETYSATPEMLALWFDTSNEKIIDYTRRSGAWCYTDSRHKPSKKEKESWEKLIIDNGVGYPQLMLSNF